MDVLVMALSGSFFTVVFHLGSLFDFRRHRRRSSERRS
jgi:hypothetical protein